MVPVHSPTHHPSSCLWWMLITSPYLTIMMMIMIMMITDDPPDTQLIVHVGSVVINCATLTCRRKISLTIVKLLIKSQKSQKSKQYRILWRGLIPFDKTSCLEYLKLFPFKCDIYLTLWSALSPDFGYL